MFAELREFAIASETSWESGENISTADATYRYTNLKFVQVNQRTVILFIPLKRKTLALDCVGVISCKVKLSIRC